MIYTYIYRISDNKPLKNTKAEPETLSTWLNSPIPSMTNKTKSTELMTQCGTKKTFKSSESNPKTFLFMLKTPMIQLLMSKDKLKELKMFTTKNQVAEPNKKTLMDSFKNWMKLLEKIMWTRIEGFLTWKEREEIFRRDWKSYKKEVVAVNVKLCDDWILLFYFIKICFYFVKLLC